MNVRSKAFREAASLFRCSGPGDWRRVSAADVLSVPGCGKTFLRRLRLYLARHAISLRNDNPPAYWLRVLQPDGGGEVSGVCPFRIVVDVNETLPFSWDAIRDSDGKPITVPTIRRAMYRDGLADYSIDGMEHLIQIERKGDDLPSSLAQRRDEFESEIRRLSEYCEFAAVVVEHPWRDFLRDDHEHGARARSISRTVLQWQVLYPGVHWWFCEGRHHAENVAFRLMERFWWTKQREAITEGLCNE